MLNDVGGAWRDSFAVERDAAVVCEGGGGMLVMIAGGLDWERSGCRGGVEGPGAGARGLLMMLSGVLLAGLVAGLLPGRPALASARAANGAVADRTWYVRPDGGDRKQCTGLADAGVSRAWREPAVRVQASADAVFK